MCSIIGSFSKDDIIKLCELNAYRGQLSHSISYITQNNVMSSMRSMPGKIDYNDINIPENSYCLVHLQAPTSKIYDKYIHPSICTGNFLWHNGIVKQSEIERLNEEYKSNYDWDTDLINCLISHQGPAVLSDVDGSFACVWHDIKNLYIFRNELAPLFLDAYMNMSSTKFEGSYSILPNIFYKIDLKFLNIIETAVFKTKQNPYYFG